MSDTDPPMFEDEPSQVFRARVAKELGAARDLRTSLNTIKVMLLAALGVGFALGAYIVRSTIEHESRITTIERRAAEDREGVYRALDRIENVVREQWRRRRETTNDD